MVAEEVRRALDRVADDLEPAVAPDGLVEDPEVVAAACEAVVAEDRDCGIEDSRDGGRRVREACPTPAAGSQAEILPTVSGA
jgi:hypothetical protein